MDEPGMYRGTSVAADPDYYNPPTVSIESYLDDLIAEVRAAGFDVCMCGRQPQEPGALDRAHARARLADAQLRKFVLERVR